MLNLPARWPDLTSKVDILLESRKSKRKCYCRKKNCKECAIYSLLRTTFGKNYLDDSMLAVLADDTANAKPMRESVAASDALRARLNRERLAGLPR